MLTILGKPTRKNGQFCDGVSRRSFLKIGGMALGGISLPDVLRAETESQSGSNHKAIINIYLPGGPSHMDTFDLKPDAPDEYRGEFSPIQTNVPGIYISEHLPKLAQVMDKFCILRGVSHSVAAHQLGTEYVNTGNRPLPSLEFPGYGAVISKELSGDPELPKFVAIPRSAQRPGYLGVRYAPMNTTATPQIGQPFYVRGMSLGSGLTVEDVDKRNNLLTQLDSTFGEFESKNQLLDGLDQFGQQAHQMITSPKSRQAFDISKESPEFAGRFGKTGLGASCLLALRLVEAGVRFITVTNGGWDTHRQNFETLKGTRLPELDQAFAALLEDLADRGLLDSTIVLWMGEFGRTPTIDYDPRWQGGRHHYAKVFSAVIGGGGFNGGHVVGSSTDKGEEVKDRPVLPWDIGASIMTHLGIPYDKTYEERDRNIRLLPFGTSVVSGGMLNELT